MGEVPELLFHTVLTVIDFHVDTSGSTQNVYVLGTHTTLEAAKTFSYTALEGLGYSEDDFVEYETRAKVPLENWKHGDGVMVYAKAPAGQVFKVSIDTKPNNEQLPEDPVKHVPVLPKGFDHLHYVLQTKIDYNLDRSGAIQQTEIEGCYVKRADALAAAKNVLADMDRDYFSQYDERDKTGEDDDWPFGEDVIVHAVAETGENYRVCVRTVPGAHKRYSKTD
ncbi:hypothetical protein QBC47DRAFT_408339 [Echria macrotheca]|uniref:Uncharacterized protein n=1 Tax=Echria macrotheca TaxID=438768 RepID=A0AAJ0BL19_9PEZI|nr:hypothetical protein QBC47DRAFT_408339 [Echria macrotheca]